MQGLCRMALAALVLAACGRDSAITGLDEPPAPPPVSGGILALGVDSTTGASIETNKDDYSPGEVVHLVGRGWAPGETISLHMSEAPNTHADVDTSVVADATGGFSMHFYDVQLHDLGVTFTLSATGQTSNSVAVATFTDGNVSLASTSPVAGVLSFAITSNSNSCTSTTFTLATSINFSNSGHTYPECTEVRAPTTTVVSGVTYTFTGWLVGNLQAGGSNPISHTTGVVGSSEWLKFVAPNQNTTGSITAQYAGPSNVAPTANAGGPYTGNEGSNISLNGSASTDTDGTIASYAWSYAVTSADAGATCTFSDASVVAPTINCTDDGTYSVKLTVTDDDGASSTQSSATLSLNNVAPTATAGGPYGGNVNASISLNGGGDDPGNNDDAGLTYAWTVNTFGNGTCSFTPNNTTKNASISCTNPSAGAPDDVFKLSLTASDDDGGTSVSSVADLTITNQAPTSVPGGPYGGNEGSPIGISGSGVDPDGGTVTFEWSASTPKCTFTNANAASTNVTCTDNGNFTLTLKATDDEGAFTTNTAALNVANVKPTIGSYTLGVTVDEGGSIPFAVGNVTDPSSDDQSSGFTYAFACGANPYGAFGASNTANCNAGDGPGSVTIKGKAMDKDGGVSDEVSSTFTVVNVKPTITAATTNSPVSEGSNATMTVTGVTDPWAPDVAAAAATYAFACDGSTYGSYAATNSVSCPTVEGPGTITIGAKVKDKDGAESDPFTRVITILNVAPSVQATGGSGNEGSAVNISGSFTDPGVNDTHTSAWSYVAAGGVNGTCSFGAANALSTTVTCTDNGTYTLTLTVTDDDGGAGSANATLTLANVNPTVQATGGAGNEGSAVNIGGSFTDPGSSDTHTIAWSFAAGAGVDGGATCSFGNAAVLATTVTCTDDGTYTLTLTVTDDDGGIGSDNATLTIQNAVPSVQTTGGSGNEGAAVNISGSFTDAGSNDSHTSAWSYVAGAGVDDGATCTFGNAAMLATTVTCTDNGTYTLTLTVTDDDGGVGSANATLTVSNVAPSVTLTSPTLGQLFSLLNGAVPATATFTDQGSNDSHQCRVELDGTMDKVGYYAAATGGNCNNSVLPTEAGVYNLTVRVKDDDGGEGVSASVMIVVYDPSAGFVTGGGWINSPGGAYKLNTALAGKATFGFVSKYKRGATTPDGNTEFQFHAGGMNFHSSTYQWLVVNQAGTNGQFKGTGSINGQGSYTFMLWATDNGNSGDTFRIQITDNNNSDAVVYDNGAEQVIASGSIVIHTGGKK